MHCNINKIFFLCLVVLFSILLCSSTPSNAVPEQIFHTTFNSVESVTSLDGTISGGKFIEGRLGSAYLSDKDTDYIDFPLEKRINVRSGTIDLWVMFPNVPPQDSITSLFDFLGSPSWWNRISLGFIGKGKGTTPLSVMFNLVSDKDESSGQPDNYIIVDTGWKPGEWHHIAASWDNVTDGSSVSEGIATIKLYLDGVEVASQARREIFILSKPDSFRIGAVAMPSAQVTQSRMPIAIDELKIWNEAIVPISTSSGELGQIEFKPLQSSPKPSLLVNIMTYFYKGYMDIKIDGTWLKELPVLGVVKVYRPGKAKPVTQYKFVFKDGFASAKIITRKLQVGMNYSIVVSALDAKAKILANRKMLQKVYGPPPNIDPRAGVSRQVLPPWTPMTVNGSHVSCFDRTYDFSKGILPAAITTRGDQILASPISLLLQSNGVDVPLLWSNVKFTEKSSDCTIMTGKCSSSAISVDARVTGEFDGMFRFDLTLTPKKKINVDKLVLSIPIKSEYAKYLQYNNGNLSESGSVSIGSDGWEWNNKFMPVLWIGDDERGLCWFSESDKGWLPYDRLDTVSIRKTGETIYLDLNILQSVSISKPIKLTFGFQATPVKPAPKSSKNDMVYFWWPGGPYLDTDPLDYRPPVSPEELAKAGVKTLMLSTYWASQSCIPEPCNPKGFKKLISDMHGKGIKVVVYFNILPANTYSAWNYYGNDWLSLPIAVDPPDIREGYRPEMYAKLTCYNAPQYVDWLTGGIKQLIKNYGIDGVYFDNGLFSCRNHSHGCGYLAESEQGIAAGKEEGVIGIKTISSDFDKSIRNYRKTYTIWKAREAYKRVATLFKTMKPDSYLMVHMSQFMSIPYMGFFDTTLDGEQVACQMPKGWFPSAEMYRRQFMREQFGMGAVWLVYEQMGPEYTVNQSLAFTLIHNQYSWASTPTNLSVMSGVWNAMNAFDTDGAEWLPYWKNSDLISVNQNDTYASLWRHKKNGLLVVISNLSNGEREIIIQMQSGKLGLNVGAVATDAISGSPIDFKDGKVNITLPKLGWKLIWVR